MTFSKFVCPCLLGFVVAVAGCASNVAPVDGAADVPDGSPPPDAQPDTQSSCSFAGAQTVRITLAGPMNQPVDCSLSQRPPPGTPPMIVDRTAAVVSAFDDANGTHVTLDYCSPAADCVPLMGSLTIAAPGFSFASGPNALRAGQYVEIRSRASWSWSCTMQVEVTNAPAWDSVPNPVRTDHALLGAAADGEAEALPNPGFSVARQSIGCAMTGGTNCGDGVPELFALSFQGSCTTCLRQPDPVVVHQGTIGQFLIDTVQYEARNHRSFNSGYCDDNWNYAWTVREQTLER